MSVMHEGPTENRLGELGSLYKYYYYYIDQIPTEFHVHQLNYFFYYNYYLGSKQQYNVRQSSGTKLLIMFKL